MAQAPVKHRHPSAVTRWIAPMVCAAVILTLGTSLFSLARTSVIFDPLISRVMPRIDPATMYQLHVFVRRSGHIIEYAILFLVLNLGPLRGRLLVAFLLCIAVASLDESLQMLSAGRSGTLFDAAEDTSGATIALAMAMPYWEHLHHLRQSWSKA